VELVNVSRQVRQKIVTWILNKMAKTFLAATMIMILYFVIGLFIMDATKMVILLFLVDFVTVSIASDNAKPSRYPEKWHILRFVTVGAVLGTILSLAAIALIFMALLTFGPPPLVLNTPKADPFGLSIWGLRTLSFTILFYFGMTTLLSVRERNWFITSAPSLPLVLAIGIDSAVVFVICCAGIPWFGIQPIYFGWVLSAILAAIIIALINDVIKTGMFRLFERWDETARAKRRSYL